MKFIAHRGLFRGPNKEKENDPNQIIEAIEEGFDCEIDLWVMNSDLWLGHDEPQYHIQDYNFLDQRYEHLWIHAKNLEALYWLTETIYKYFWHESDKFTLTSNRYIWTYPGQELTKNSIMLMPEWSDSELKNFAIPDCYGICSDYIEKIRSNYQNRP
jgi:hypothetical protein